MDNVCVFLKGAKCQVNTWKVRFELLLSKFLIGLYRLRAIFLHSHRQWKRVWRESLQFRQLVDTRLFTEFIWWYISLMYYIKLHFSESLVEIVAGSLMMFSHDTASISDPMFLLQDFWRPVNLFFLCLYNIE